MKPEFLHSNMRLYFTDPTYNIPVCSEVSHRSSNTFFIVMDFSSAQSDYIALLNVAKEMIRENKPFSLHTDISGRDEAGNDKTISSITMRYREWESDVFSLDWWDRDSTPVIFERPATQEEAEKALGFCYGLMLRENQVYSQDLDLSDPAIAEPYNLFMRAPDPQHFEKVLFPLAETSPHHMVSVDIPFEAMAQYNDMLQLTGAEIYQKYGLKRGEQFSYTTKFDDGCEMDVRLVIGEPDEHPDMFFELYDKDGHVLACENGLSSFAGEYTLESEKGSYTANVKSAPKPSLADRIFAANQVRDQQSGKQNVPMHERKGRDR